MCPRVGTIPKLGRWPKTPQNAAGMRMEPPRSLPSSRAERPALIATAEPPEEPPAVRDGSHGLFVVPKAALYVWMSIARVERFVLPKTIAPAALSRATAFASRSGT